MKHAYMLIAKAQNVTTNPTAWLQCQHALLYIDQLSGFTVGKIFRQSFPSL